MNKNTLYFGDNLDVSHQHVKDESVDLIYLDPPFNSNANYNVLFAEKDGTGAASQIKAFGDTWKWDHAAALAFQDFVATAPLRASQAMQAFSAIHTFWHAFRLPGRPELTGKEGARVICHTFLTAPAAEI